MNVHSDQLEPRPVNPLRLVFWILANKLDCEVFTTWCRENVARIRAEHSHNLVNGLEFCRLHKPTLVVLDPEIAEDAVPQLLAARENGQLQHLLILDRRLREFRLVDLLPEPAVSYLSRQVSMPELARSIAELLEPNRRIFDPAVQSRIRFDRNCRLLEVTSVEGSITSLSMRERQVLRLLAEGHSVQKCADSLGLSHSTIDNHKSRMMKKLGLHKMNELTIRAVRDGLLIV